MTELRAVVCEQKVTPSLDPKPKITIVVTRLTGIFKTQKNLRRLQGHHVTVIVTRARDL